MTSAGEKRNPPRRSNSQKEPRKKRQRQPSSDAVWCLENLDTLSLESFALHFGLTQKLKTMTRYRNILNKYISDDHVRKNLLDDLKNWSDTINFVAFWQERARTATVAQSRADCSSFVNNLIMEVTPKSQDNVDQNINVMEQENEDEATLNDVCNQVLGELIPENTAKINDSDFIKVTDTINAVDSKSISVREGKRDLLNLAATMNDTMGNIIEGLANLLTKLPRLPILDMSKIGEVELQSTYFDVFLSEIIADQDKQVALRWANKSVHQDLTDMRPDAIISTLVQYDFGCPLGFGEAKVGNISTTKQSVNLDIFRLGITCKRAIERHGLPACLAFMINGYEISFFIVSKRHDCLYTMMEIASLNFASSLSNLHTFATRKNLDLLAAVSNCFWSICAQDLPNAATIATLQDNLNDPVPISNICHSWPNQAKETLVNRLDIDFYSLHILSGIVEAPIISYIPLFSIPHLC
ncbi:MAG: hypothetical protein EXX96DRAFT_480952 [Benjaminiella poitrasii]|nr:MAG: hypothetical protein EXX96DRAFT_480952 [Benjaminiella poitrasii]